MTIRLICVARLLVHRRQQAVASKKLPTWQILFLMPLPKRNLENCLLPYKSFSIEIDYCSIMAFK